MGRIIQAKNGQTVIHTVGEEISLITAHPDTYVLGVDAISGIYEKLNPNGDIISLEGGGAAGGGITAVTWSDFASTTLNSGLNTGMLYIITDFRTCYDQPDFDYNGTPITSGNYKQGPVEPIIVLATSNNAISSSAYQPAYPKDRIQYDWYWGTTEVTNGAAFGRITERIDQFNNRTDYDHRNILFKRYKLFTTRTDQPLNGTIQLADDGIVSGFGTSFNNLTIGDVISIPSTNPSFYEIINITDDTTMTVSGDTITAIGAGQTFYKAIEETNDTSGYFSFKRTNVKTNDFVEYTTFGDALDLSYAKNNYIGNYANNYQNVGSGSFLLSNNVFLEGQYESNKFGDYCYNNTFGTDNSNNVWGDYCYENVSTNDIDGNIIGHYFYNNLLNVNFIGNRIGNYFYNNKLLAENSDDFSNNEIGDHFYGNLIYSYFYNNIIGTYFYENTIGDFGNLIQFSFFGNQIGSKFYGNTISKYFSNNLVSGQFYDNGIYGDFSNNQINFYFFDNRIVSDSFTNNIIGTYFYANNTNDDFFQNITNADFNNNVTSNSFQSNVIGNNFQSNTPSNLNLFGWRNLTTVVSRTYDTFYNALDAAVGNRILGKEFVMRITSTSQYFKIIFTQWSQNGLGGGFQYIRTEIDSAGNTIGDTITFTNVNNAVDVDIVVPGVLEITRGAGGGAIYNTVGESGYSNSVSPVDTEWNSIYTEPNNGKNFAYNKIRDEFRTNVIGNDFGFGGSQAQGNVINDSFQQNTIGQFMYNNVIGNYFTNNTLGDNFESNSIKNYFIGNTIANGFEGNQVGDYFGQNGGLVQNTIFNNFKYNKIGNFFGNEFNFPTVSGGTGANGGNIINDGFQFNQIGDNCIYCMFDLNFDNNQIGNDFWFNFFGANNNNNTIGNLFVGNVGTAGFPSSIGNGFVGNTIKNYAGFNQIGAGFINNEIGNYFGNGGSSNYIASEFSSNKIGNYFGDDGSAIAGENLIYVPFGGNEIGVFFYNNTINNFAGGGEFYSNKIGNGFYGNTISGYTYYNEIGHDFYDNSISDEFHSNEINSNFYSNIIGYNFNNNILQSDSINSVDFNTFIGNISTYALASSSGGTDGVYSGLPGTTNGTGIDASFNVVVSGSVVTSVALNNAGQYYAASDTFVIDGSLIGGVTITDNVTININTVTEPSVYGNYNCTIFKRPDGENRLSYYDDSDVLNIKDIKQ